MTAGGWRTAGSLQCRATSPIGFTIRHPSSVWAQALWELPEKVMKFTLNAAQDTLPHNANLHLWKKLSSPNCPLCFDQQTLNHCPVALLSRRYNQYHDVVLELLHEFTIPAPSNRSQWTSPTSYMLCYVMLFFHDRSDPVS